MWTPPPHHGVREAAPRTPRTSPGWKVSPADDVAKAMIWKVRSQPAVDAQWTDSEIIGEGYVNFRLCRALYVDLSFRTSKAAGGCAQALRDRAAHDHRAAKPARSADRGRRSSPSRTWRVFRHGHGARRSSTPGGRDTGDGHDQAETVGGGWRKCGRASSRPSRRVCDHHRIVDGGMSRAASSRTSRSVIEEPALLLDWLLRVCRGVGCWVSRRVVAQIDPPPRYHRAPSDTRAPGISGRIIHKRLHVGVL
jgi:hypothetical protein